MTRSDRHGGRAQQAEVALMGAIAVLMFALMVQALPEPMAFVYGVGVAVAVVIGVREADRLACANRDAYRCQACQEDVERMEVRA